jgi:hypothetical protein
MSTPTGFFDVLYLGVFITVSPVLDTRFYALMSKGRAALVSEVEHALAHFHSLLHDFSERFMIVVEGETIAYSYVLDRMVAEFAAAVAVLARSLVVPYDHELADGIPPSAIVVRLRGIVQGSYPTVYPYFVECLERGHKDFLWTGPQIQIIQRSEASASIAPLMTVGELLDLPGHTIYQGPAPTNLTAAIPAAISSSVPAQKRDSTEDSSDSDVKRAPKRRR